MDTVKMSVEGLNLNAVTKALQRTKGIQNFDFDLMDNVATITFDDTQIDREWVQTVVKRTHHNAN